MSLKNWLTYIYLRATNWYFSGNPKIGAYEKGIWRYKTKWRVWSSDWEPMGGQAGDSIKIKRTITKPVGKMRKFRIHALKKMSGLYPCSDEERRELWEIWKHR